MTYKLVAIDMDGTLLNSQKKVTEKTKKVLLEAQNKGVRIVITTGRIFSSAKLYSEYIGLTTPIIGCNGAIINGPREKILKTFPIDKNILVKAAQICEDIDISYFLYTENKIYSLRNLDFFKKFIARDAEINPEYNLEISYIKNVSDILSIKEEILKFNIWDTQPQRITSTLHEIHKMEDVFVTSSSSNNIELTHVDATKGNAIKFLAENYGINQEEIIAIGDSYNDKSMIKYAGLGVAMENAREDIKNIADYITLSNDEDGIVKVFEKFVL